MLKRNVTIIETKSGWLWAELGQEYKSLHSVRRAIARNDAKVAKLQGCITTLTIKTNTPVGALIAAA